jgi:hypothetical protein
MLINVKYEDNILNQLGTKGAKTGCIPKPHFQTLGYLKYTSFRVKVVIPVSYVLWYSSILASDTCRCKHTQKDIILEDPSTETMRIKNVHSESLYTIREIYQRSSGSSSKLFTRKIKWLHNNPHTCLNYPIRLAFQHYSTFICPCIKTYCI